MYKIVVQLECVCIQLRKARGKSCLSMISIP